MKIESKNFDRRLVVGDIHGCSSTLKALVKKLKLCPNDAIFFVGDYIDRGPDSSGVIDFLIELKQRQKNVFFLRGNHEDVILKLEKIYSPDEFSTYARVRKSLDLLQNGRLQDKYRKFFDELPYYYELEDFLIVHAGFSFKRENFLANRRAMLNIRDWDFSIEQTYGKRIVHGHQPHKIHLIEKAVAKKLAKIPIDCGCVYTDPKKYETPELYSRLCCVELNSFELICQKNIELTH